MSTRPVHRMRKPPSVKAIKNAINSPFELISYDEIGDYVVIKIKPPEGGVRTLSYDFVEDDFLLGDATLDNAPPNEAQDEPGRTEILEAASEESGVFSAEKHEPTTESNSALPFNNGLGPVHSGTHQITQAYAGLSAAEQKEYWRNMGALVLEVSPGQLRVCRHVVGGYQTTDKGLLGAIFVDDNDHRHLVAMSIKTGVPFRLSQPRPPKRP